MHQQADERVQVRSAECTDVHAFAQSKFSVPLNDQDWTSDSGIQTVVEKTRVSFGSCGRVLIRAAGTEPVLRVIVEGESNSEVTEWVRRIAAAFL